MMINETVVNGVSSIIWDSMVELAREQEAPQYDTDRLDDKMKRLKLRIENLSDMRSDFEVLMTGVIL